MLTRARKWLRGQNSKVCCGYEHASYVLANVVVLVTPNRPPSASGWNDEHTIQVRKWMKNVASKHGDENAMVFVSPCSGIDPSSALRAVFVNKSVDLGHSSHFCLPRMAPELKFIESLCQSVCTWLRTETDHLAVLAVSQERAALLVMCIQAYAKLSTLRDPPAARQLYCREYFALCDRLCRSYRGCLALRAHQFFLKNWISYCLKPRAPPSQPDSGTFRITQVAVSGATAADGPDGPANTNQRIMVLIAQGEQCVYNSMASPGDPWRTSPQRPSPGGRLRFPVDVAVPKDADLVVRVYRMAPGGDGRVAVCSVSVCAAFAAPSRIGESITITSADIDDVVPGQLTIQTFFSSADAEIDSDDDVAAAAADATPADADPTGVAGLSAGLGAVAIDESGLSGDARMALAMQRRYDLEAERSRRYNADHPEAAGEGEGEHGPGSAAVGPTSIGDSATASNAAADDDDDSSDGDDDGVGSVATDSTVAEEQLATDEAFARALQAEFNADRRQARRRVSGASSRSSSGGAQLGGGGESESMAHAALRQNPVEFLRMLLANSHEHQADSGAHCIATLPVGTVGAAQLGQGECEICYEPYELGQQFRMLPCMHRYHRECIDPWLLQKSNPLCPVCNTPVNGT